jgi:hypothetical protein
MTARIQASLQRFAHEDTTASSIQQSLCHALREPTTPTRR